MKKVYKITGKFLMGEKWRPFAKEIIGTTKKDAEGILLSEIGSKHRVKRRNITIHHIEEISKEQVESPVVKYMMGK